MILQQAWKMSLDKLAENREKIAAMALIKDCYQMKLDLLSSATVIDRAIKFVERHRGSMPQNDQVTRYLISILTRELELIVVLT